MAYTVSKNKEEAIAQLKVLIDAFQKEYAVYNTPKYSEAQLRIDFINPLLKTFGWDVDNESTKSQFLRDVIQEEAIDVEEDDSIAKKNPDYTLRIQGIRKLFIEAKKVSVDIEKSPKAAFQTRRYGWNANLGVSILTNFEKLIVYDCRYKPNVTDDASAARYRIFNFVEYITHFDELYELLSYPSVGTGFIDNFFSLTHPNLSTFDEHFLEQIETWRKRLAADIIQNNTGLNEEDLNFLIQRLLNRIVFLRICEDREIEKYATLKEITNYEGLKTLFIQSDKKYNSGLFDFIDDNFSLKINLHSEIIISIFNELYYPESPYDFSVVDPAILSQIYERYLGSRISISDKNEISIVEEPEVAASSGVVPTPKLIVNTITKETLSALFEGKDSKQIAKLKIADICCGSGTFLISVYDLILEYSTLCYVKEGIKDEALIYQAFDSSYHLTLKIKHELLLNSIYGVDINPYAAEVTKFSLLLKLLENENAGSVDNYLAKYDQKVLPDLDKNIKTGNSLVDYQYFKFNPAAIDDNNLLYEIKPFDWFTEFPFLAKTKGFDAIVGNPPYVRIQNMVKYIPEEIKYYQNELSGYTVAQVDTFDKYYLFIQRAVSLLNEQGVLGYIVPNKFFVVKGGKALRWFISSNSPIYKIVHFGVKQVFPTRSTYVAVLILTKNKRESFHFKRIKDIILEFNAGEIKYLDYRNADYQALPWIFVSKESETVFNKIKAANTVALKDIAEIPVGLQTSADKVYIIQPIAETETTYKFLFRKYEYEVEKSICKPCLYDLSFSSFDTVEANALLIFPYSITDGKAVTFSEQHFQGNYPLAWSYLNNLKPLLERRNINGSKEPKWYQFGRSQSLTKFHNTKKVIWPVLSTKSSYVLDEKNLLFTGGGNGPYYSLISNTDYSPLYIMGILSHPLFEAMVKAGASEFRGAYYSHGKQFIENLPIKRIDFNVPEQKKQHNDVVKTVTQIIATKQSYNNINIGAKRRILQAKLDVLNNTLIEQVNQLYQITNDELEIVLNDEMFLTDSSEE
jgi:hypothetical protein